MIGRLFTFLAVLGVAAAQNQCTSFASLVRSTTGAPPGLAIPDCSYIQANSATICNSFATWDIANADTCYLKGPGYGCTIVNGQFSTTETFYCQIGPASTSTSTFSPMATSTTSPSPSASASVSPQTTGTPSPSASASVSPQTTGTPSPSASASVSPQTTSSGSASPLPSISPLPTQTSSPSSLSTATSTLTSTPSTTPTMTPFPSMNQTIVFVYTTVKDTSIGTGQAAAIGLSAIFGICLLAACGHMIRKRPTEEIIKRTVTVIERRSSKVAEPTTPKVVIRTVV